MSLVGPPLDVLLAKKRDGRKAREPIAMKGSGNSPHHSTRVGPRRGGEEEDDSQKAGPADERPEKQ